MCVQMEVYCYPLIDFWMSLIIGLYLFLERMLINSLNLKKIVIRNYAAWNSPNIGIDIISY